MALKTFNVDEAVYGSFSGFCKENGLSMSKQIEMFMRSWIEKEPRIREDYLKRLEMIRKQKSIRVGTINALRKRYSG
jgi:antitoxin component of RelBE/YafQ-DinJ toxin-antitoxin module